MRDFQKVLHELKELVGQTKAGDQLRRPESLPQVNIKGRRVSYAVMGKHWLVDDPQRSPVLLIHGFGGFFMDWPRVMASISRKTAVFAIDLPGWGFSEFNPAMNGIEDDVTVVHDFLEKLDLKNVLVAGISYGAGVCWAAASLHMPRALRYILLNPMAPNPLNYLRSPLYKMIFQINRYPMFANVGLRTLNKSIYKAICRECLVNYRLLDTFYLDLAYRVMKQPDKLDILRLHARGVREVDWAVWQKRLRAIVQPISILQGRDDRVFDPKGARDLANMIPSAEFFEIIDCGHAMVFDQHKRVSEYIISKLPGELSASVAAI
jgi:pimeloyl-ACP methyl ester carboxylesterase